jgi:hypothetical protein
MLWQVRLGVNLDINLDSKLGIASEKDRTTEVLPGTCLVPALLEPPKKAHNPQMLSWGQ